MTHLYESPEASCDGDGLPTNVGWQACQQWLVCLPTVVGLPANSGWSANQRWLVCQRALAKSGDSEQYIKALVVLIGIKFVVQYKSPTVQRIAPKKFNRDCEERQKEIDRLQLASQQISPYYTK